MSSAQNILVVMSGGTIDAEPYERTPDRVIPLKQSVVPELVHKLGFGNQCDFQPWIMKDSQDFTPSEIMELANIVLMDKRQFFIVTHGTDAMVRNAQSLEAALQNSAKTVFFVGAMEPLKHGHSSDGEDNLKLALQTIKKVEPSVYIIGRGEVAKGEYGPCMFKPGQVEKNRERKIFVLKATAS